MNLTRFLSYYNNSSDIIVMLVPLRIAIQKTGFIQTH
nr:MAG TPA: hypothetical protein [Caudoviricetes sp.]